MTEDERLNHVYLGDGVYMELTPRDIILRTGDHRDVFCDNKIHLDQTAVTRLLDFLKSADVITWRYKL